MEGRKVSMGEVALAQMKSAPDPVKIAFAIQLITGVSDPAQAAGMIRLGRLSSDIGHDLMKEQFVRENEG